MPSTNHAAIFDNEHSQYHEFDAKHEIIYASFDESM
jgi:hypothetical protein